MPRHVVIAPRNWGGPNVQLLHYPALAAIRRGADVTPLEWTDAPLGMQARPVLTPGTLVIGSSKGSRLAPLAAELDLPAIWIAPVLAEIASALRDATAPFLLIGGSADDRYWDGPLARSLTPHVLEFEGADHQLLLEGGLAASAQVLGELVSRVEQFMDDVVWPAITTSPRSAQSP